jgi:hypothetical protein
MKMANQKREFKHKFGNKLSVKLGSTQVVSKHQTEIDMILDILGHPEALVTDQSLLSDFCPSSETLAKIKKVSGKAFGTHAGIIVVAESIRKNRKKKALVNRRI